MQVELAMLIAETIAVGIQDTLDFEWNQMWIQFATPINLL